MTAGRVGKPHGHDGSFHVERATHPLTLGTAVVIAAETRTIVRRSGTGERPLIRLEGVTDPRALRGELLLVEDELGEGEWLASQLVGATVRGHGSVLRVLDGPSCSVLELEDGTLVPFVADAIRAVREGEIEIDEGFLG